MTRTSTSTPPSSQRLAGFVRSLRAEGFALGSGATLDLHHVLMQTLPAHAQDIKAPLLAELHDNMRSLLCTDHEQWQRFPELFERYWLPVRAAENAPLSAEEKLDPRVRKRRIAALTGFSGSSEQFEADAGVGTGAGRQTTLSRTDFRFLTDPRERRDSERLAERMARSLPQRRSRRRRIAHLGRRWHLRRTLRSSFRSGGLPLHPRYSVPRQELPRLVLLQDISHSMARHNPLFMRFSRGLLRIARRSEAFAFHTRLYRVSDLYREREAETVKRRLEQMSHLWLGGTRIADSLAQFNRQYANGVLGRRSVVVIMSDGYDSDDPEALARELALIRSRVASLLWLNPTLSEVDSATASKARLEAPQMPAAVLESVDQLLPANSLQALSRALNALGKQ